MGHKMAAVEDKLAYSYSDTGKMSRTDWLTSLCPCPVLTAYWTSPPAWPRRLCDSRLFQLGASRTCCLATGVVLMVYFLLMDILLYTRYRTVDLVSEAKVGQPGEVYSPFTHLTVKAIVSDHLRHYIFTPTAEYFTTLTHFTELFPFITANMVSFSHLVCAFISGKFVASENLQDRRIGVALYVFRTWLDSLDGIVFRARTGKQLQYNSVYSSSGYIVDALFDTLGGFFLSFGVLFYVFKRFGPDGHGSIPVWVKGGDLAVESPPMSNGHPVGARREAGHSYGYLFLKVLSYGVALSVAGIAWDRVVKGFTEVFQVSLADPNLTVLQFEFSHSYPTLSLFFLWRFISGQTVLNYLLIAIYLDKIWEFLRCTQWILLAVTLPLYFVTDIYIRNIHWHLNL